MTAYIIRRLLILPIILLGVSILIFSLTMLLGPLERVALYVSDIPHTSGALEKLIDKYGLNDPVYVQYWHWLVGTKNPDTGEIKGGVLRGDLGWSHTAQMPVMEAILERFPPSAELALYSVLPLLGIGIWLGVQSALHHNKFIDQVLRTFSIIGYSFPTFVFGLLMLMIFYSFLQWFPPERLSQWARVIVYDSEQYTQFTHMFTIDALLNRRLDIFIDAARHLVLPVIGLSYLNWALVLRVMRSSMLETLRQDYITTARSKGLAEKVVINLHARKNALIPVATIGGLIFVGLLSGVVITETIYNLHGMGLLYADAALRLDIITLLGLALFNSLILVLGNLTVDILYAFIDPRVRLS
ncbi:MAG: peptide ABC transporter permease [Chloroflexi bacterium RBG_16_48_8]|nr:MAG: peptide ABC transporter permease [Chloroflexi bacterium RBG_16_48_8]